jgi:hypothetical protein
MYLNFERNSSVGCKRVKVANIIAHVSCGAQWIYEARSEANSVCSCKYNFVKRKGGTVVKLLEGCGTVAESC